MQTKVQVRLIVLLLLAVGLSSAVYKNIVLGFSFLPEKAVSIWTVETAISFEAEGGPVTISLNLPDTSDTLTVLDVKNVSKGYTFKVEGDRAVWRNDNAEGESVVYLRSTVSRHRTGDPRGDLSFVPIEAEFSKPSAAAADALINEIATTVDTPTLKAIHLLEALNSPENDNTRRLHDDAGEFGGKIQMACALMQRAGIKARAVNGLQLAETKKKSKIHSYIEIEDGESLILLNPRSSKQEERKTFSLWQTGDESQLMLTGGFGGEVSYSVLEGNMAAERVAVMSGKYKSSFLVDFSIYSLPIKDQNTFRMLLLIPIGALVVVILRNLVGISTSGTFMPILIAMVFLQTSLFSGLALFIVVVGVGLVLRSYLSHLNLLLVPRISAVLVFVIIIYVAISVTSFKLGIETGLLVTFFPMIIISWTIERMSVLWEEEGPRDVFTQGGGSLFAASLIYFAMGNSYVGHLTYSFPELLLVVLAVIIMIGSYTGYRLTELRRFQPLASKE